MSSSRGILFCSRFLVQNIKQVERRRPLVVLKRKQHCFCQLSTPATHKWTMATIMKRLMGFATGSPEPQPLPEDSATAESYENAIQALNGLQSNAATIAKIRLQRDKRRSNSIQQTVAALLLSGLTLEDLDALDIVHVAGTKGKGMTCAFTESILRQAGLKTGFFSSPHLTAVRERIRVDGRPISEEQFAKTFFSVYNKLKHLKAYGEEVPEDGHHACEMPNYFRFLTLMAFHVFVEERVDAVILEVGIGGTFDTTNIIRQPVVVGITALGLEHQRILGNTLEEIAANKAGIMKPGVPAFTVHTHPPEIQAFLKKHAADVGCSLQVLEPLNLSGVPLGVDDGNSDTGGSVAAINAGLAVRLANELIIKKHSHMFPKDIPSTPTNGEEEEVDLSQYSTDPTMFLPFQLRGLELTQWDGRYQKITDSQNKRINYFLDGAHTADSLNNTLQWFNRCSSSARCLRLLVFNLTGDRDSLLMQPLIKSEIFDLAIFCPMVSFRSKSSTANTNAGDNWSVLEREQSDLLEGCRHLARVWEEIQDRSKGVVLGSAEETLDYIRELAEGEKYRVNVLVTGSLHLVGSFLAVMNPTRNSDIEG